MILSVASLKGLGAMLGASLTGLWLMFVKSLARSHVTEFSSLLRTVTLIFIVSCCLNQHDSMSSETGKVSFVFILKI